MSEGWEERVNLAVELLKIWPPLSLFLHTFSQGDNDMSNVVCPKCKSEYVKITGTSYPNSYECKDCNYSFIKGKQALIDE